MNHLYALMLAFIPWGCAYNQPSTIGTPDESELSPEFKKHWHQGKAEVSSYDLVQARYGELHKGTAVLVFVTEDFSRSKQVKLDNPTKNPADATNVMKLNMMKEFETGIYKYSMMQSVFTPIEREVNPYTLKVSTSVQDWCGHIFSQINLQSYKYKVLVRSYFESEGDEEYQIDKLLLEDEIWNLIRINPALLPEGSISILPSSFVSRLLHKPLRAEDAEASFVPEEENSDFRIYKLQYATSKRSLEIKFAKAFPYQILGWTETYTEAGKELSTTATLKKTMMTDYWTKHSVSDANLRTELGLD